VTPPAAAAPAVAPGRARPGSRLAPGARPPRRVSGPARRPSPDRAARRVTRHGGLLLELLSALEKLSSHRLLDRLLRGRAWLVLLTSALIGIVTLQLTLLKLNGAVGRALAKQAVLQRENASLSIENSELAATDRVQARAAQMGMEFATSRALRFLAANAPVDLRRGALVLSAPARSSSTGSEEAGSGGSAAAGSSASGAEGARAEAPGGEAPAAGPSGASSEAGPQTGAEAAPTEGSTAPASGEASPSPAAQAPAGPGPSPSPAGGTQASPNG